MPHRASNVSILVNRMISFLIAGVRVWRPQAPASIGERQQAQASTASTGERQQASASASENRQAPANASKRRRVRSPVPLGWVHGP